ncbi:MAG: cytochrome c oxidase subunit 3 [Nitrospinota bacterium]|jgi:heme/copper-type cytochrome/quinol oxidase subunit 3|nr:cytochrome c oxidase subunit 3 [Nitrospinota bacterium]
MSFGGLLAAYGAARLGSVDWPNPSEVLGINLTAFMTFLLICSSVTMVKALSAVKHGDGKGFQKFMFMTISGGVIFLALQAYEWTHLISEGLHFNSNPWGASLFGATFFAITGFHGMHVTGGVIYLSCVLIEGKRGRFAGGKFQRVEVVGLYWHFVDLVWILVFTFVYLL